MPHGSLRRRRSTATTAALGLAASLGAQAPQFARTDRLVPTPIPRIVAIGDFNGDGMDDFNGPTRCDSVGGGRYEAVGPGIAFSIAPSVGGVSSPYVAVADFNGDGADDVVQSTSAGFVYSFLSGGPPPANAFPAVGSGVIAAGDPDGDGDQDLAVQHGPWPNLLLNDGNGVFTAQVGWFGMAILNNTVNWMRFADLDGDGFDDLVGTTSGTGPTACFAQRSFGNGTFDVPNALAPSSPSGGGAIGKPAIGDVDGDGRSDVLFAYGVGTVGASVGWSDMAVRRLLPSTTYFTFDAPVSWPIVVGDAAAVPRALVDLDQDGAAEIVVGTPFGIEIRKFLSGTVGTPTSVLPVFPAALVPLRADADGRTDLAAIWWTGGWGGSSPPSAPEKNDVTILFNDGVGSLAPSSGVGDPWKNWNNAFSIVAPKATDIDGDGDVDLLNLTISPQSPLVLTDGVPIIGRNDGHGTMRWEPPAPCPGCPFHAIMAAEDADADGDRDLFLYNGNQFDYLRNDGAAGFADAMSATYGQFALAGAAADFDGDGDADIAVAATGFSGGPILMFLGGAAGWTSPPIPISWAVNVIRMIACDFDFDGDPDLLFTSWSSATVLRNDGGGVFTALALGFAGAFTFNGPLSAAEDFDGDGDLDFFTGNVQMRQIAPTFFAPRPGLGGAPNTDSFVVRDFDGDGDLDALETEGVLFTNDGSGNFSAASSTFGYAGAGTFDAADFDGDGDVDVVGPGGGVLCNLTRQLETLRTPRPGLPYDLRLYGQPFAAWAAVVAFETSFGPVAAPPYGRLALDPALAYPLDAGGLDAFGAAALTQTLDAASTAALAGVPLVVQAVVTEGAGFRLTNSRRVVVGGF